MRRGWAGMVVGVWRGAAAVCRDREGRVLLVQLRAGDRAWVLPGGGLEDGESPEAACVREVREEAGYGIEIRRRLCVKTGSPAVSAAFELHVFAASVVDGGGSPADPDGEVGAVGWFPPEALAALSFAFAADRELVRRHLRGDDDPAVGPWFKRALDGGADGGAAGPHGSVRS